jgi:PKD repeat protein
MKKITLFSTALLFICLFMGVKNLKAQTCTVSINYTQGANGLINFTGVGAPSTFTTNYFWSLPGSSSPTFGGSGSGFLNPSVTYSVNGTYTVTFGMFSAAPLCSVNITQTISVTSVSTTPPCTLQVNYVGASTNTNCNGSATVANTGNMCGATTYTWSTGATGSSISGLCAGSSYTVIASSPAGVNCCSVAVGVVNIPTVATICNLNANFNWTQSANGNVNFNNTTTNANGGTTYSWAFGDGGTSTSTSPSHNYPTNGVYSVTLTANNNTSPACVDVQVYTINVSSYCNINAGFTYVSGSNGFVSFNNTTTGTTGPTGYSWAFGDNTSSTSMSPGHTYALNGTYTVILTVTGFSTNPTCSDTAKQIITISNTNTCTANASFSCAPTGTAQYWNAFPTVPSNITAASWSWGDGNTSNTLYTSHSYSAAGTYSICLSVTVSCGATATFCQGVAIFRSSQDMSMYYINVVDPNAPTAIKNNNAETLHYSVYPNPNNGSFNLKGLKNGPVSISIFNVVGKLVYQTETNSINGSLAKDVEFDGVANGVYFLKINSDNKVVTSKMILEK